ncbi:hypothetical protein SLS53_008110 [Cytospora paraplurivora]|uniref:DUF7582 domain-containing protein n=1 Tax=Cytospora paraplurivora TaxID=2898453 RepID=A0AAN9U6S8_9PEZI
MALKALISSPLEAGTSILDAHRLPSQLTPALEYTSKRLARKGLHITLVVARRDYQLPGCAAENEPGIISATDNQATNLPTPPASPASPDVVSCGPRLPALKSLVRSGTDPNPVGTDRANTKPPQRSKTISLTTKASLASLFDGGLGSPRLRWPLTPKTPSTSGIPQTPRTPATPATPASSITTASNATSSAGRTHDGPLHSIRLIHTTPLAPKADRLVTSTFARATRKFNSSATALTALDSAAHNIHPDALHRSILQNEVLFSSEGLTILSLDHLYTFKGALAHYAAYKSEPGSDFRLEDAVDELRRYILSSAGRRHKLLKSVLFGTYEWLGPMDEAALGDVKRMYCRAYGGMTEDTVVDDDLCKVTAKALEGDLVKSAAPAPPPRSDRRVVRAVTVYQPAPPLSARSQPQSPQNWVVESHSPMADEDVIAETPQVKDDLEIPAAAQNALDEEGQVDSETTPTAPKAASIPTLEVQEEQKLATPEIPTTASPEIPFILPAKAPSPRASPKASLPALKLQTTFRKPKPLPMRKTTPMPKHISPEERKADILKTSPSSPPRGKEDDIEIVLHATVEDEDDGDTTEFEDGDLTARPPPSAVSRSGGALWLGGSIDEVIGDRQQRGIGHGGTSSFSSSHGHHHRRSSSLGLSPIQQHEGPTTPNGYEDISPITRGEWGFLMVSDPFKTKTAAVETF